MTPEHVFALQSVCWRMVGGLEDYSRMYEANQCIQGNELLQACATDGLLAFLQTTERKKSTRLHDQAVCVGFCVLHAMDTFRHTHPFKHAY